MEPVRGWKGSRDEWIELMRAVEHNCGCGPRRDGRVLSVCSAHQLLVDRAGFDRLLFARRIVERLRAEEASPITLRRSTTRP
jgi:hypothetical protein